MDGLDAAGIDVVCNIYPGKTSGKYSTEFNYFETDFSHWGLSKLASSASHLDPKKNGMTISEAYGAYGWSEGLKTMKWITDIMCVRGVNQIVPHAFSPSEFPDADCPPHFYARGHNPQFRSFNVFSDYANRVCHLISDGAHVAPVAVLYHAEAEWGGKYEPFEKTVKILMQNQIDCDVVPCDTLINEKLCIISDSQIEINKEKYKVLIVPYSQYLPKALVDRLSKFSQNGLPVFFINDFPERCYLYNDCDSSGFEKVGYDNLASVIINLGLHDIELSERNDSLSYYHYKKQGKNIYFFVNESTRLPVKTSVKFKTSEKAYLYDAMSGKKFVANQTFSENSCEVSINLQPFESIFVIFDECDNLETKIDVSNLKSELIIEGDWKVSTATSEEYPIFNSTEIKSLGNISLPELYPTFAGTVRYEISFKCEINSECIIDLGRVYELADVCLNDNKIGTRICPPYQFTIKEGILKKGFNKLVIDVTNTLSKSIHNNVFDRYWPQEPSGLLGLVRILY
jgi:hypothetical protein